MLKLFEMDTKLFQMNMKLSWNEHYVEIIAISARIYLKKWIIFEIGKMLK